MDEDARVADGVLVDLSLGAQLAKLQGLNVEPSTITDFKGVTVLAYHVGTATGHDGTKYNLETDTRVMQRDYVGENGKRREANSRKCELTCSRPGRASRFTTSNPVRSGGIGY